MNLCNDTHRNGLLGAITRTDAYNYVDGTTPPDASGGVSYNQTFSGPFSGTAGFVLSNSIAGTLFSTNIAAISGQYNFRADVFGFRLGPYLEYQLGKRTFLALSAGFAMTVVNAEASWNELATTTSGTATRGARGSATGTMWGGYVGLNISHQLSRRWSVTGGVQWQDLSDFTQDVGAKQAVLELSGSVFVTIGLSYSF